VFLNRLKDSLKGSIEPKILQFKSLSSAFYKDLITGHEYYSSFISLFDESQRQTAIELLFEIIRLLPEERHRIALHVAYVQSETQRTEEKPAESILADMPSSNTVLEKSNQGSYAASLNTSRRSSWSKIDVAVAPEEKKEDFPAISSDTAAASSVTISRKSSIDDQRDSLYSIIDACLNLSTDPHPRIINRSASKRYMFLINLAYDGACVLQERLKTESFKMNDRKRTLLSKFVGSLRARPDDIRDSLFIKKLGLSNFGCTSLNTFFQFCEGTYESVADWCWNSLNELDTEDLVILCDFVIQFAE
jgi:hypothetical protein